MALALLHLHGARVYHCCCCCVTLLLVMLRTAVYWRCCVLLLRTAAAQVRLYRVRWFFRYLEYDLTVSLLTVTVARNLVIVLYLTHWVACGFNLLARSGGYDPDLLVGLNPELFASISLPEQYVYSLYWSVTTLAGAARLAGADNAESTFLSVYRHL